MSYWRTLFNRQTKPPKPYYPVSPVDPPTTTTVTTVTVSQSPPSTGGILDFSDPNNSALIALLGGI